MSDTNVEPSNLPKHRESPWGRYLPWGILTLVLASVVLVSIRWDNFEADRTVQTTDDAAVQSDSSILNAKISAYATRVNFIDFQTVHAGDVLVQLDDREANAAMLHAQATLAKVQAVLDNLDHEIAAQRAMITQARANVTSNTSRLRLADQDNRRFSALADSGAVTGQEADSAMSNAAVVRATHAASVAAVDLQNRQLDVLSGQRAQRKADVLAAQAALETARITLSYTRIIAPVDGTVGQRLIQTGSLLNPGTAVANFVASTPPYIVANYKETQLSRIAPDQSVEVFVDSFPGQRLLGRVSRLGPASGATFSAVPPDNATGNFTKVTQRIPLRIDLNPGQPLLSRLRAGMSVTTRIDTHG